MLLGLIKMVKVEDRKSVISTQGLDLCSFRKTHLLGDLAETLPEHHA